MKENKLDVLMLPETRMDEEETRSEKWRHIQGAGCKAFASSKKQTFKSRSSHPARR